MFERFFGKKPISNSGTAYELTVELHPFRLPANKSDRVDLEVMLTNRFDRELMTSVVVTVPKGLGFEQSALSQEREIRLGMLKPSEVKHFKVPLWGTQRTEAGLYPVEVHAISHYHDYAYVLNEVKKELGLRVV